MLTNKEKQIIIENVLQNLEENSLNENVLLENNAAFRLLMKIIKNPSKYKNYSRDMIQRITQYALPRLSGKSPGPKTGLSIDDLRMPVTVSNGDYISPRQLPATPEQILKSLQRNMEYYKKNVLPRIEKAKSSAKDGLETVMKLRNKEADYAHNINMANEWNKSSLNKLLKRR